MLCGCDLFLRKGAHMLFSRLVYFNFYLSIHTFLKACSCCVYV